MGFSETLSAWGNAAKKALLAVGIGAAVVAQGATASAAEAAEVASAHTYVQSENSGRLLRILSIDEQAALADEDVAVRGEVTPKAMVNTPTTNVTKTRQSVAEKLDTENVADEKTLNTIDTDTANAVETKDAVTVTKTKVAPQAISSGYVSLNNDGTVPPLRYYTEKVERPAAPVAMATSVATVPEVNDSRKADVGEPEIKYAPEAVRDYRSSYDFSLEARFFAPNMNASVGSDKISYNGGRVNLRDDLNFGGKNAPEFLFRYGRLGIDYIPVHETAHTNIGNGNVLIYQGKNYQGDVKVKSDFDYVKIDMTNPLNENVDWLYGLTIMKWKGEVDGKVNGIGSNVSESESYTVVAPMLGVGLHAPLAASDKVTAHAKIAGLPLGGRGHFYDFEVGFDYNPVDNLGVTLGYRRIKVAYNSGSDHGRISLHGPYLGVRYSF